MRIPSQANLNSVSRFKVTLKVKRDNCTHDLIGYRYFHLLASLQDVLRPLVLLLKGSSGDRGIGGQSGANGDPVRCVNLIQRVNYKVV